jgi:hypothetical protein
MTVTGTLDALMLHNDARLRAFREHRFFRMLEDGTFDAPDERRVLLACVRRFNINFQRLIFIRQGLCEDPRYYGPFLQHLGEEIGHDELLSGQEIPEPVDDTIFEAILGWFNYQMLVLDNVEKAALMHLVIETGGDLVLTLLSARMRKHVESPYFDVHAELDAGHAGMAGELLAGQTSATYRRLGLIADRGWDMTEALFDRLAQLVTAGAERQQSGG